MIEHYELMSIFPGTKTDEEIKVEVDRIRQIIKDQGATIVKEDFWGKRKLAYEINHIHHGFYDVVDFDLDSSKLMGLDKVLGLDEAILRHQLVRRIVRTPEQIAKAEQLRQRLAARRQEAKEKETVAGLVDDAKVEQPSTTTESAEPLKPEEISEKLEEILDQDKISI